MDDGKTLIIVVLLAMSAFFSGSETALFSLSRIYLKKLENSNKASAKRILNLLKKPRQLLITLLLGNTFVNIGLSSFATLLALQMFEHSKINQSMVITLQIVITTVVILFFGEIIPKLVAMSLADVLSGILSFPITIIKIVLFPVVWLLEWFSSKVSSKPATDKHMDMHITHEEFHNLIQSESSSHTLEEHEKKMLVGLFRFREAEISEIYVPRVKITAVQEDQSLEELKDIIVNSGYSRIPVYKDSIDDIIGIVYVKDLILHSEHESIKDLMRPVWFITENMKVQALLNQFKQKKLQVAVVVDEYGGTSGIISLEDILEEIVGEIQDEYDVDEIPEIVKKDEQTYIISGTYAVRSFNQEFNTEISADEYDNIAEYLLANFNHVPSVDETMPLDDRMVFTILDSDEKSIKRIRLDITPGE